MALGATWTSRVTPTFATGGRWYNLAWSPELGLFNAVGAASAGGVQKIMTSPDGVVWTGRSVTASEVVTWRSVCWCGGTIQRFVAVKQTGTKRVATSTDGLDYTNVSAGPDDTVSWWDCAFSPDLNRVVAVGNGKIGYSSDGVTWNVVTKTGAWAAVCWSVQYQKFIAMRFSSSTPTWIYSADGITWTDGGQLEKPAGVFNSTRGMDDGLLLAARGMAASPARVVIISAGNDTHFYSNTSPVATASFTGFNTGNASTRRMGICYADAAQLWVCVGYRTSSFATSGVGAIMSSVDGVSWIDSDAPANRSWRNVVYAPALNMLVAITAEDNVADAVITNTPDLPAPTVISISPAVGPVAGGTAVTVTGTNFTADSTVVFGSGDDAADATDIVFVNSTTITCVTPAHAVGSTDVTVTNPSSQFLFGTLAAGFTFQYEAGTPLSVTPAVGTFAGGTPVTIAGFGFVDGATVAFDGKPATEVVVVSSVEITCVTPAHASGAVDVTVENP
jgi:hypothetical protein